MSSSTAEESIYGFGHRISKPTSKAAAAKRKQTADGLHEDSSDSESNSEPAFKRPDNGLPPPGISSH